MQYLLSQDLVSGGHWGCIFVGWHPIVILEVTVEELDCVRRDHEVPKDIIPHSDFLGQALRS